MTTSCTSYFHGTFETHPKQYTKNIETGLIYDPDSESTLRGKFTGLSVWQSFQAVGHVALRIKNLVSGASFSIGRRKAYDAYLCELKEKPDLRGKPIEDYKVLGYQLWQLAADISMLVLFVVAGIILRELIALSGIVAPLDARVWYGQLEEFFYSEPRDIWNEKSSCLEFFSFSGPCMQTRSNIERHRRRRCEACCSPEHVEYQPKLLISRIHLLEGTVAKAHELFLSVAEKGEFDDYITKMRDERRSFGIKVVREIRLQNGAAIDSQHEQRLVDLRIFAEKAIAELVGRINQWTLNEDHSQSVKFTELVQKTFPVQ